MKIIIPEHIKTMVNRIVKEYESLSEIKTPEERLNEKISWRIETADKTYVNNECYLYFLQSAQKFRKELDSQDTEFFKENDEYQLQKKIVFRIEYYLSYLPVNSCYLVTRDISCEEKLEKALKRKRFKKGVRKEALSLLNFIQKRQLCSWEQIDEYVDCCFFKYINSEQELENLLSQQEYIELTPGNIEPFKEIRVAYLEQSKYEIYEKKGILNEFEMLLNEYRNDDLNIHLKVFDMWNDIKETGIYYVFIPKITK